MSTISDIEFENRMNLLKHLTHIGLGFDNFYFNDTIFNFSSDPLSGIQRDCTHINFDKNILDVICPLLKKEEFIGRNDFVLICYWFMELIKHFKLQKTNYLFTTDHMFTDDKAGVLVELSMSRESITYIYTIDKDRNKLILYKHSIVN